MKKLQYRFELQIQKVYFPAIVKSNMRIWWKMGNKKVQTETKQSDVGQQYYYFNKKFNVKARLTLENGIFQPKNTILQIVLFQDKCVAKNGGELDLELTSFIDPKNPYDTIKHKYQREFTKTPFQNKKPKIIYTLVAYYQKDITHDSINQISFQMNQTGGYNTYKNDVYGLRNSMENSKQRNSQENQQYKSYGRKQSVEKRQAKSGTGEGRSLEFSFNPAVDTEREKERRELLDIISDLRMQIKMKSKQIDQLKQIQNEIQYQRSQKTISTMNELNKTKKQSQSLRRELYEAEQKMIKIKEQNNRLYNQIQQLESRNKSQQRTNEIIRQLEDRIEKVLNENDKLKSEVFRKQSELISIEDKIRQLESSYSQRLNNMVEEIGVLRENKLQCEREAIVREKLTKENQRMGRENQEIKNKMTKFEEENRVNMEIMEDKIEKMQAQFRKEREAMGNQNALLSKKFKEKQDVLREIENEFNLLQNEKNHQANMVRQKYAILCKKYQQLFEQKESTQNNISQLKVKIQSLTEISGNLQKDNLEKQALLQKAKKYITEQQEQIEKRNEFIQKAREYIQSKQRQFQQQRVKHKQQMERMQGKGLKEEQIKELQEEVRRKDQSLIECHQQLQERNNKIEELETYLKQLMNKIDITQDEFEEVARKSRYQYQSMQDLIKKNLDLQIAINVKNCEIEQYKRLIVQ